MLWARAFHWQENGTTRPATAQGPQTYPQEEASRCSTQVCIADVRPNSYLNAFGLVLQSGRKPGIVWDEENLHETSLERGTRRKIDEPDTPYHYPGTYSRYSVNWHWPRRLLCVWVVWGQWRWTRRREAEEGISHHWRSQSHSTSRGHGRLDTQTGGRTEEARGWPRTRRQPWQKR